MKHGIAARADIRDQLGIRLDDGARLQLLVDQRERIARREAAFDERQLSLDLDRAEAEQMRRDRRRWQAKFERLELEIVTEPERVRRGYDVAADRLEIVGLLYLWPKSN